VGEKDSLILNQRMPCHDIVPGAGGDAYSAFALDKQNLGCGLELVLIRTTRQSGRTQMLESIRATAINDGWAGQDRRHHYDWNPVFFDEYVRNFTAVDAASKGLRQEYRLMKALGLMPEQYRERWQLCRSYPMVTSNYAATRAQLASTTGLGCMQKAGG